MHCFDNDPQTADEPSCTSMRPEHSHARRKSPRAAQQSGCTAAVDFDNEEYLTAENKIVHMQVQRWYLVV